MLKLCFTPYANTSIMHVHLKLAFLQSAVQFKVIDELADQIFLNQHQNPAGSNYSHRVCYNIGRSSEILPQQMHGTNGNLPF